MAETATIDLNSYISTNTSTTTKSASKSYADNPYNFSNALEKANKSYDKQETKASDKVTPQQNTKTKANKADTNITDKSESGNNVQEAQNKDVNSKIKEKNNDKDVNSKNVSQDKQSNDEPVSDNVEETKLITDTETETKTDIDTTVQEQTIIDKTVIDALEPEIKAATPEIIAIVPEKQTTQDTSNTIETPNTQNTVKTQGNEIVAPLPEAKTDSESSVQTEQATPKGSTSNITEVDISQKASQIGENVIELIAPTPKTADAKTNTKTETNVKTIDTSKTPEANDNKIIQPDFRVELNNSAKNLETLNQTPVNKTQVQSQINIPTQQVSTVKIQPQTQEQLQVNEQSQEVPIQSTNTETPLIKVNTEILAANTDVNPDMEVNTKQNTQNVLNKTPLNQEVLDKTDAKIVNLKNPNSFDTNSSNKNPSNSNQNLNSNNMTQNTQDQLVKLSLESTSTANTPVSTDFSNITADSGTGQIDFSRTHNTTQMQMQPQTSTYKELSSNEILSQIHNKLSSFKGEDTTKISIILQPENLGKINVELINSREGMTAQLTTNNPQVKEILDKSLDGLKDTLSNQGVNVNNVTVKVEETQKQSDASFSFEKEMGQNQNQNQHQQPNNDTKGNKYSFGNEIDSFMSTVDGNSEVMAETDTEVQTEKLVSVGTIKGKVNYKV